MAVSSDPGPARLDAVVAVVAVPSSAPANSDDVLDVMSVEDTDVVDVRSREHLVTSPSTSSNGTNYTKDISFFVGDKGIRIFFLHVRISI